MTAVPSRINLLRNGHSSGGKVCVKPDSFAELLSRCSAKFSGSSAFVARRIFTLEGFELEEAEEVFEGDTVVVSSGEDFIEPSQLVALQASSQASHSGSASERYKASDVQAETEEDVELVDSRIRVWWTEEKAWYAGRVVSVGRGASGSLHTVAYDDGLLATHYLQSAELSLNETWEAEPPPKCKALTKADAPTRKLQRGDGPRAVEVEVVEVWPDEDSGVLTVDAVAMEAAAEERDMTAEEAVAQAASEGLVLVHNRRSATGYYGVHFDNRVQKGKRLRYPYSVYLEGTTSGLYEKARSTFLGTFATAEQAALVYARRTDNRAERIIADVGRAEGSRKALAEALGHTVVCRRCQGLVNLQCARRGKRAGALFAVGDGCFRCSSSSRPGRLRKRQTDMAQAVQLGTRTLVAWPKTSESRVAVQLLSPVEAAAALAAALGALVPEETRIQKSVPRAPLAEGLEETPARRSQRGGKARALWLED